MSTLTNRLHLQRLKEKGIVIEDIYQDNNGVYKRSSDFKINDAVSEAKKIQKNFYCNDKLIYTEKEFDPEVKYSFVPLEKDGKFVCSQCGYEDTIDKFYDGCPYCGSYFKISKTKNKHNFSRKKTLFTFLENRKSLLKAFLIIELIAFLIATCDATFFANPDDDLVTNFIISFLGASVGIYIWALAFYIIFSPIIIPILLHCRDLVVDNLTGYERKYCQKIDNNEILQSLHSELLSYYYDMGLCPEDRDLIDFDILEYSNYKFYSHKDDLYIEIKFVVKKYFFSDGKMNTKEVKDKITLKKNKQFLEKFLSSNLMNKCLNCGAPHNDDSKFCSYCHSYIPSNKPWIISL